MSLTGAALVAGITGYPVAHSLSPLIHGVWIRQLGLNAAYVPFPAAADDFADVIHGLQKAGVRGVNVTVPHKERAFAIADEIRPAAKLAGAANVLVFKDGKIIADNTDSVGLVATLHAALGKTFLNGQNAVVAGAGGMARAALCALSSAGMKNICVLARRPEQAEELITSLGDKLSAKLSCGDFAQWPEKAANTALLVNATSAGMGNRPPLDISVNPLPVHAAVFDAVYTPLETPLLKQAKIRGLKTIDGLGLLLHQAVPSFEAFFGPRPEITEALRDEVLAVLHAP